jgi:hypothetical protein
VTLEEGPLTYQGVQVGFEVQDRDSSWHQVTSRTVSRGGGITFQLTDTRTGQHSELGGPPTTTVMARWSRW